MKLWPFKKRSADAAASTLPTESLEASDSVSDVEGSVDTPAAVQDEAALPAEEQAVQDLAHGVATDEVTESSPTKRQRLAAALSKFKPAAAGRPDALPIRIIMGYLPEVSARDAKEYALGMAEKHFEQMGLSHFDAYEFGNGYVYEAHEGGSGKAFSPEIIKHFEGLGPYQVGEVNSVIIRTATRFIEVQRMREGLAAILLPEAAEVQATSWLQPTKSMTPGFNRRTSFLYAGIAVFATGVLSMLLTGTVFRLQPYAEAVPQRVENISVTELPRSQWARIEALPPNSYVRALRYRNDKWEPPEIVTEAPASPAAAAASEPAKTSKP